MLPLPVDADTHLRNGTLAVYEAAIRAKRMQKARKVPAFYTSRLGPFQMALASSDGLLINTVTVTEAPRPGACCMRSGDQLPHRGTLR